MRSRALRTVARLFVTTVMAVGLGGAVLAQPAQAACYNGLVPGSSRYVGSVSVHVYGSACTTRWARIVWDDNDNCCIPLWGKVERQVYGTYGWTTSHKKTIKREFGAFGTHNTATVPWIGATNQRFVACYGYGVNEPWEWTCGPAVG